MRILARACRLLVAVPLIACGELGELPSRPAPGNPAPEVAGATLAGDTLTLSELEGSPVLLNLWATWCPPCREEMPYFEELRGAYADSGLRIVGVSVDGRSARDQVVQFTSEVGITYDIVLDPRGRSMDAYQAVGLPATFLIDTAGIIRLARYGPVSEADTAFHRVLDELTGS